MSLPTVDTPCFVCGAATADPLWTTPDRAFAVPGVYTVARCRACGFLYQRPRVRNEYLAACYPDHYPRHQEPSPRIPFKGSAARVRAARWALGSRLGYGSLREAGAGLITRVRAALVFRRIKWDCPPWRGQGRYLDVGCGSGGALGVAQALGCQGAGLEGDEAAAKKARRVSHPVDPGGLLAAPVAP